MKFMFLSVCFLIFFSCSNSNLKSKSSKNSSEISKSYVDSIKDLERASVENEYDGYGRLISTISFEVRTTDLEEFEDGIIPWARIDSPEVELNNIVGKDERVILDTQVKVVIDYPVKAPFIFSLTSASGFTRSDLIMEISRIYHTIYEEEERSSKIKTVPVEERKIYNRNRTDGKYGIWGHDIGDLLLDQIDVHKDADDNIILILEIES